MTHPKGGFYIWAQLPENLSGLRLYHAALERLKAEEEIDGIILGGTELPLILTEPEIEGIPLLDTTRLHVEEAVSQLLL